MVNALNDVSELSQLTDNQTLISILFEAQTQFNRLKTFLPASRKIRLPSLVSPCIIKDVPTSIQEHIGEIFPAFAE